MNIIHLRLTLVKVYAKTKTVRRLYQNLVEQNDRVVRVTVLKDNVVLLLFYCVIVKLRNS